MTEKAEMLGSGDIATDNTEEVRGIPDVGRPRKKQRKLIREVCFPPCTTSGRASPAARKRSQEKRARARQRKGYGCVAGRRCRMTTSISWQCCNPLHVHLKMGGSQMRRARSFSPVSLPFLGTQDQLPPPRLVPLPLAGV